ncbi:MAG: DUF488 family protein, partial [Candidatus Dormibacteraceae bacterium]
MPAPIHTVGHSTRSLDELAELLTLNGVQRLVDVRSVPGSRRLPHFAGSSLAGELPGRGIEYIHLPGLGGRRRGRPGSPNAGWRNRSFRAYADHMLEEDFRADLERLLELASERPSAIMCAEAVPWRCHRRLVADALTLRGSEVLHITGRGAPYRHSMTPFARVEGGHLTYPGTGGPGPGMPQRGGRV